ncbi:MAG: 16S rRNA (guanine(966)-N(2))-methyltransferase RsmD [Gemmatimonadetes bacterium]|nr:16S rRNA (guanine(966)-N(2))-methyltransferase RsmD [Gemmatimonadota bacterium]
MRIVGGRWAGTDLVSPGGRVRPTAEELRAAWLDALGEDIAGAQLLDLFAGSGALGLEALSRGAASVDFVENGRPALHALRANVARFRTKDVTRVFVKDAMAFVDRLTEGAYDIALADPPYTSTLSERLVERWRAVPFARILGVEHAADRPLPGRCPSGRVGEGAFTIYRIRDS